MTTSRPQPSWLANSVLYQIYPQTFADSDGDGIGDLAGASNASTTSRGWVSTPSGSARSSPRRSPTRATTSATTSPSRRATGRTRTSSPSSRRRAAAASGSSSTSSRATRRPAPWFREWASDPSDGRYVWNERVGTPAGIWCPVPGSRGGYYLLNFYPCQPALNFGYARQDPRQPWRDPVDAEGPRANRQALKDVMAHWFDLGISGFRVDMASSLVKDDPGHVETGRLWTEIRGWLDTTHPDVALIAEWGDPRSRCRPASTPTSSSSSATPRCGRCGTPGSAPTTRTGPSPARPSSTPTVAAA